MLNSSCAPLIAKQRRQALVNSHIHAGKRAKEGGVPQRVLHLHRVVQQTQCFGVFLRTTCMQARARQARKPGDRSGEPVPRLLHAHSLA